MLTATAGWAVAWGQQALDPEALPPVAGQSAGQVLGKRAGAVRTAAYRGLRKLSDLLAE